MTDTLVYSTATPVLAYEVPTKVQSVQEVSKPSVSSAESISLKEITRLVEKYATPLGVSHRSMIETIKGEAPKNKDGTFDAAGQSRIINSKGVRENSWGICQIHLPDHPYVTKAQAQSPEFCVKFMAEAFARGDAKWWSVWKNLKAKGVI